MTQSAKTKKIFDGRYEILEIVGRGACSVVYHARHSTTPVNDVALKVLLNKKGEPPSSDRLRKEALAMVSSRHRYVIRLDDFHSVGDLCYLSMEFAPFSDLRKYIIKKGGELSLPQIERFFLQSAEALGFIHRSGIIHRDIKPDNILVMNDNEIRLGDFGVAVLPGEESALADLQKGVGTLDYMAPEVIEGIKYDQRSDVYALGVTFYEIISGKHPFAGASIVDQLTIREKGKFAPLSELAPRAPKYLTDVIMKALSYHREERFATGREMLQAMLVGKSEAESAKPAAQTAPQTPTLKDKVEKTVEAAKPEKSEKKVKESTPPTKPSNLQNKPRGPMPKPGQSNQRTKPRENEENRHSGPQVKINEAASKSTATIAPQEIKLAMDKSPRPTVVISPAQRAEITQAVSKQSAPAQSIAATMITETKNEQAPIESGNLAVASKVPTPAAKTLTDPNALQNLFGKLKEAQQLAKSSLEQKKINIQKFQPIQQNLPPQIENLIEAFKSNPSFRKATIGGLACLLFAILWGIITPTDKTSEHSTIENNATEERVIHTNSSGEFNLIPKVTTQDFTFPRLAPGMYTGKLGGLISGQAVPLTIISLKDADTLVIILGIQGWSPAIVPLSHSIKESPEDPAPRLRFSSNGAIYEFTGQNNDGELLGYFSNLVTGEQGNWDATPVK